MKMRRRFFAPVVLSLLVGIMGGLVCGGTSALAAPSSVVISIGGTVDGLPESVTFSGLAHVRSTVVRDPDFGSPPAVILAIDFLNVSGIGLSTGSKYVSGADDYVIRVLRPSDAIDVTFAFFPRGAGGFLSARSAVASFTLTFDNTGKLTSGTATISTPNIPLD